MLKSLVLGLIKGYQYGVSPLLGPHCRFYPSCSCYAQEAIVKFGASRGLILAFKRVIRCHPGQPGGVDPLP